MNDDLLQGYLARLESGEPLESVLAGVPAELVELVRMAVTLRGISSPLRAAASVNNNRRRLVAAAKGGKTMSDPSHSPKRRIWGAAFLAGAAGLALLFLFIVVGVGVLLSRKSLSESLAQSPNEVLLWNPMVNPQVSVLDAPNSKMAVLRETRGLVEIQTGAGSWRGISAGEMVSTGEGVRTGPLSSATLAFFDGSIVSLGSGTEIQVSKIDARQEGARVIQIVQVIGETDHVVVHSDDPGSLYEVIAATSFGRAQGTAFHVSVSSTQTINFMVTEGAVAVTNAGETIVVSAGQTTLFDTEEPPLPPASYFNGEGEVAMIGEFWYVAGQTLLIDPTTVIEGDPQIGDWVTFEGRSMPGGVRVADRITLVHRSVTNTFSFAGTVETLGDTEWVVSGKTVAIDAQTIVDAQIGETDLVEVSGIITAEGVFLARDIRLVSESSGSTFTFTGVVESMEPVVWVISDLSIVIVGSTVIDPEIVMNDVVQVTGQILADGTWQAETIEKVGETGTFDFAGVVVSTEPWNVSGVPFDVDDNSQIDDGIQTGNRVRVQGTVLPDGSWLAVSIMQYDEGQRHAIHFSARVESIDPWIIGGTEVTADNGTQIIGEIQVGDLVAVKGNLLPDGTIVANKISLVAEASGCMLATGTVAGFDGTAITLDDGRVITLTPSISVKGTLELNAAIVFETCTGEDSQPILVSVSVIGQPDTQMPAANGSKVVICHIPSGDLSKAHTISVGVDAVESHLAHGDTIGPCP